MATDFRRHRPVLDDELLKDYLAAVTSRQSKVAQILRPISIEVTANRDTTSEVAAFPGGYLFVPLSLLVSVQDEAELAGSLAHALAHVAARHATREATRGRMASPTKIPAIIVDDWTAPVLIPRSSIPFRHRAEAEADQLAIEWMARAGYAPAAWAAYLERVKPPSLLPLADRIASMTSAAPPDNALETGGFAEAQARARSLVPPPAPPKPDQPPTLRRRPKTDEL